MLLLLMAFCIKFCCKLHVKIYARDFWFFFIFSNSFCFLDISMPQLQHTQLDPWVLWIWLMSMLKFMNFSGHIGYTFLSLCVSVSASLWIFLHTQHIHVQLASDADQPSPQTLGTALLQRTLWWTCTVSCSSPCMMMLVWALKSNCLMWEFAFEIKAEPGDQLKSDIWIIALWEENLGVNSRLDCRPLVTGRGLIRKCTGWFFWLVLPKKLEYEKSAHRWCTSGSLRTTIWKK